MHGTLIIPKTRAKVPTINPPLGADLPILSWHCLTAPHRRLVFSSVPKTYLRKQINHLFITYLSRFLQPNYPYFSFSIVCVSSHYYFNSETSNESSCDLPITLNQRFLMYDNELFIMCEVPFYFMKPGRYHLSSNQNDNSRLVEWCQDQFSFNSWSWRNLFQARHPSFPL